jgi:hypothetical protein
MIPASHLKELLGIWSERGERSVCALEGNCMSPTLRDGNRLVLKHGNQNLRRGDVVVFGTPGSFLVHRVVKTENRNGKRHFLLKADRSPALHAPLTEEAILAKVLEVHGPDRHLHLDSRFWRCVNYLMAVRSYVQGRCSEGGGAAWKCLNGLLVHSARLLPARLRPGLLFREVIFPLCKGSSSTPPFRKREA